MKRQTETISFRLNADIARLIDREREPVGISRGEYVRGVLINKLENDGDAAVATEIIELRQAVLDIRGDIDDLTASLKNLSFILLTQSKPFDKQTAQDGVRRIFNSAK